MKCIEEICEEVHEECDFVLWNLMSVCQANTVVGSVVDYDPFCCGEKGPVSSTKSSSDPGIVHSEDDTHRW